VLYERFPDQPEGVLTAMRARLVSREGLRVLADQIEIGTYLMLGRGEEMSGGRNKTSSLADAYEALIGAIYLDSDYATARRIVLMEARTILQEATPDRDLGNPKGALQEILQDYVNQAPAYLVDDADGPDHRKSWTVTAFWQNIALGAGSGTSKRLAEIAAAEDALQKKLWTTAGLPKKTKRPSNFRDGKKLVNKKSKLAKTAQ
jgi:ribonuclease-3